MISFWEQKWFFDYDTIIIGGGLSGLSTAASLLEKQPDHKVLILERNLIPTGASTKNAGFVCFGSLTEIYDDIQKMGEADAVQVVKKRYEGIQALRKRLGDEKLDLKFDGGYEVISEKELPILEQIEFVNKLLRPIFDEDVFSVCNEKIEEFGFNPQVVKALVGIKFEGSIDTGKTVSHYIDYVQRLGARILTGANVLKYKHKNGHVDVKVASPSHPDQMYHFTGKTLAICTNAFTNDIMVQPKDIWPGRGQIILTKPMRDLKFKGTFHFDEGFYYFRNYYDRILFGGGRNLDFNAETTDKFETTEKILGALRDILMNVVSPESDYEVDQEWAGIMAFGDDTKDPIVKEIERNVFLMARMCGMGVALTSKLGEATANKILAKHRGEAKL